MTALPMHVGDKPASSIEHGLRMLRMNASLQGAKEPTALLEAQSKYPNTPLHVYFVASGIVEAAITGQDLCLETNRARGGFLQQWQRDVKWLALDQPVISPITYTRTEAIKPLRSETQLIDWDAEFKLLVATQRRPSSPAFTAFTELRTWLSLSVAEAAKLVGVGRTTPTTSWQKQGHPPRPKQARRLLQLHALVSAVVRQLGSQGALQWLHTGSPSPFSLMEKKDLAAAADAIERLTIRHAERRVPLPGSEVAQADDVVAVIPTGRRRAVAVSRKRR
jgi:hypothetical protein